jgi:hypothetical protein
MVDLGSGAGGSTVNIAFPLTLPTLSAVAAQRPEADVREPLPCVGRICCVFSTSQLTGLSGGGMPNYFA